MLERNPTAAEKDLTFRPLLHSDIQLLAEWIHQIPLYQRYGMTPFTMKSSLETAIRRGEWLNVLANHEETFAFAWCLEQGTFGVSPYLRLIAVRPGFQGQGLGRSLLSAAETWAKQSHDSFTLLVSDFNEPAQRFYRRAGYTEIGRIPHFVLDDVAEIIYHKSLTD